MREVHDGYGCEVMARGPDMCREWMLGDYRAGTPRLALRWLRGQACRLADALDPSPGHGPFPVESLRLIDPSGPPNPGRVFREWLNDLRCQEQQLSALVAGRHISVNAGGPDRVCGWRDTDVLYSLSCRPIALTFLTDGRSVGRECPSARQAPSAARVA
jgi:hypothetical protein